MTSDLAALATNQLFSNKGYVLSNARRHAISAACRVSGKCFSMKGAQVLLTLKHIGMKNMNTPPAAQSNAAFFASDHLSSSSASEHSHGVSWQAILAGATGAAVLSMVLVLLGTGIGFSVASPWEDQGVSSTTLGLSTIIWITVVQILSSIFGGVFSWAVASQVGFPS